MTMTIDGEFRRCRDCDVVYTLDHFNDVHDGEVCIQCQIEARHERQLRSDYYASR